MTVSHGVTTNSLSLTAKVAGWDWMPMANQPLLWLFTLPFRLLPAGCVSWGLNFFAAVCAALTLGLLARTMELLSWDRSRARANRLAAKLPVLLACAVCGLQFSFWQEATAATGEMLDLLFLAASLWLLLEYRVRQNSRWLEAAAVVWGLGMAENWLMLLVLPLFVLGVIWLQIESARTNPFNLPFVVGLALWLEKFQPAKSLLRLAGFGLAGFSIYVLLPLVNGLTPHSPWNLGQALLATVKQTKSTIAVFYYQFWVAHGLLGVVVILYFLVPVLPFLLRLPDFDTMDRMERFQIRIYRILRALLLLLCLWLAFDPINGPRQIMRLQFGLWLPMLTFDYLTALGAGFLAGNLLLISQSAEIPMVPIGLESKVPWRQLAIPFAAGLVLLAAAALAVRNTQAILSSNFHPLEQYGALAVKSLPPGGGVMLSDQPDKLEMFEAALCRSGNRADWLAVDTSALPEAGYRAWLDRHNFMGWLALEKQHNLSLRELTPLLEQIARKHRLYYLHPSYGCFFERFYLEPTGAIYEMKLRENNSPEIPPLPAAIADADQTFWSQAWQNELAPLAASASEQRAGEPKKNQPMGLTPAPRLQDRLVAEWYSLLLDGWGVTLQQQGRWRDAHLRFQQALLLNPDNVSARISLACNTNLQSGFKPGLADVDELAGQMGDPEHLIWIMNRFGPFDEPSFCYLLGSVLQQNDLWLQAARQFERVHVLAPGAPAPEFALAELYIQLRLPERARPLLQHLRDEIQYFPVNSDAGSELGLLESKFWLSQTNVTMARNALQTALRHSNDAQAVNRVLGAYLNMGDFTNALQLVNSHLSSTPDDPQNLNIQAALLLQSGYPAAAIPFLDHVLALTNLPEARLNRAIARFDCGDIAAAQADFNDLENSDAETGPVAYGLAAIADQQHDTNQAVIYLRRCLSNTTPQSLLWRNANARLEALEHPHTHSSEITN